MDSQVFIAIVVFLLIVVVPAIIEHMKNQKKREEAERQRRLRQSQQRQDQEKPAYQAGGDEIKQYLQSVGVQQQEGRKPPARRPGQPAPAPQPVAPRGPQPRQAGEDVPVLEEVRATAEGVFKDATDTLRHYLESIGIPTAKPEPQARPQARPAPAPRQAQPRPQPKPKRVARKPQPKLEPPPAPPRPEPRPAPRPAAPEAAPTLRRRRHPFAGKPTLRELRRAVILREVLTRQDFKHLPYERDLL